jgi:hypothetical protein
MEQPAAGFSLWRLLQDRITNWRHDRSLDHVIRKQLGCQPFRFRRG